LPRWHGWSGEKLSRTPADAQPADDARVRALAEARQRACATDLELRQHLHELWRQASAEAHADHNGVVNQITGLVGGNVVQTRDIKGGLSFGGPARG
jgi:post-segregation antitoxin (ccd killing protein)